MSPKKIKLAPACANCSLEVKDRRCFSEKGKASAGCPTLTSKEILAEANQEYQKPDIREFARQASLQEAECYCNPINQAKLLEAAGAEFHVLLGLCVGHDSLFLQTATVPVTILSVKDRVTGHNPLAALYTSGSYFKKIKYPGL